MIPRLGLVPGIGTASPWLDRLWLEVPLAPKRVSSLAAGLVAALAAAMVAVLVAAAVAALVEALVGALAGELVPP